MAKTSGGNKGGGIIGKADRVLKGIEIGINNQKYESAAVVDAKGNVLFNKDGQANFVFFTGAELAQMPNNVVTHNHPSSLRSRYGIGSSFSKEDLTLAVQQNVSEIRAVSGKVVFSMKRPPNGWNANPDAVKRVYRTAEGTITKKLQSYIDNYSGDIVTAIGRAGTLHAHLISKEVAKRFGWEYTNIKIKK